MQEGSRETLQRLIYHAHPNDFEDYLKYFDEKERTQLASIFKVESTIALHLDSPTEVLHSFHYSWYLEFLEQCPKNSQKELLAIFSEEQVKKLGKKLQIKSPNKKVSPVIKKFFTHKVLEKLGYDLLPPACFFSYRDFFFLTKMDKKDLVYVIHKLGIIDMASMAKKIVDKKTLRELFKFLMPEQKKLFKEAQKKYNDPLTSSTKELHKSLEDDRSFSNFVERRGIFRLAIALANENSFLVWHLAHILDKGRGKEFLSVVRRCVPNQYTAYYSRQVLEISKSLKESKSPS